ncbi:hypothetical protein [Xanthobacter flavus]|uniref:hypothetical protein n=1 Tax=Xanthobacter flavus TaxID=281 RepID=UPI003728E96F
MMKIRVVFLRDASPYAAGEAAGFEEAEARRLKAEGMVAIPDEENDPADDGNDQGGGGDGTSGDQGEGGGDGTSGDLVVIPENWHDLHHATRKKLARAISGEEPADTAAADAVIAAEVDRRAAAAETGQ